MLYLASPYTHPHGHVMQGRYIAACHAVATLSAKGLVPYSPIVHWHMPAVLQSMPRDYDFWQFQARGMIDRADRFMILELEGWESSIGIMKEQEYAMGRGLNVERMREDEIQWLA